MSFVLQPWQLLLAILAGWVNRQQQQMIEYLRTENRVLKEKLGKRRILLNDDQRRRLAVKAKVLGRKKLEEIGTLFSPDTRHSGSDSCSGGNGHGGSANSYPRTPACPDDRHAGSDFRGCGVGHRGSCTQSPTLACQR